MDIFARWMDTPNENGYQLKGLCIKKLKSKGYYQMILDFKKLNLNFKRNTISRDNYTN